MQTTMSSHYLIASSVVVALSAPAHATEPTPSTERGPDVSVSVGPSYRYNIHKTEATELYSGPSNTGDVSQGILGAAAMFSLVELVSKQTSEVGLDADLIVGAARSEGGVSTQLSFGVGAVFRAREPVQITLGSTIIDWRRRRDVRESLWGLPSARIGIRYVTNARMLIEARAETLVGFNLQGNGPGRMGFSSSARVRANLSKDWYVEARPSWRRFSFGELESHRIHSRQDVLELPFVLGLRL